MDTKLTLTLEKKVIENAKLYAKSKGRSLSDLVENYFKLITRSVDEENDFSPLVNSLKGSFKAPENFNYKEALSDELMKKYLK